MSQLWNLNDGRVLDLIAADDLPHVPRGTPLVSISGERAVVGFDEIDTDTRGGFLAWGRVVEDRTWDQRMALLASEVVMAMPPNIVRVLSDDGEGRLAVALRRLERCSKDRDDDAAGHAQ